MRKLVLLLTVLCLSAAGCQKQPAAPATQKLEQVTVAEFGHLLLYYPAYLAKQKGFYEKRGLDVNFVATGNDDKTFAAVAGGSALVGIADPVFVAIAKEKGLNAKVVGTLIDVPPFWIVTKKPVDFAKDGLKGLRIGSYPAPSTTYTILSHMIATDKARFASMKIVNNAFGNELATVDSGNSDGFITIEPIVAIAEQKGMHVVGGAEGLIGRMSVTGITTLDSTLATKRETVKKILAAIAEAEQFIIDNPEEAATLAAKEFSETKPEIVATSLKRLIKEGCVRPGLLTKQADWDAAVALRIKSKELKAAPLFSEVVDNSLVEK